MGDDVEPSLYNGFTINFGKSSINIQTFCSLSMFRANFCGPLCFPFHSAVRMKLLKLARSVNVLKAEEN